MKELLNPTAVTDCRDPSAPPQRDSPPTSGGPKGRWKIPSVEGEDANSYGESDANASADSIQRGARRCGRRKDPWRRGTRSRQRRTCRKPTDIVQDPIQARHWRGPRRTYRSIIQTTSRKETLMGRWHGGVSSRAEENEVKLGIAGLWDPTNRMRRVSWNGDTFHFFFFLIYN